MPGYGMVFPPLIAGVSLTGMIHLLVSDVGDILIGGGIGRGETPPLPSSREDMQGRGVTVTGRVGRVRGKDSVFSLSSRTVPVGVSTVPTSPEPRHNI
jgi:hypothetical protein